MMRHVSRIENAGILKVFVQGEEVLAQILRTLQVLEYSRQLLAARGVSPLTDILKYDDLVHRKDGGSSRYLTSQVCSQLGCLSVVQD
jgi:hypothetical protein